MTKPIEIAYKSASTGEIGTINTFSSYSFDQSIMTPASAFRFTAPGVDKKERMKIRSGDMIQLYYPHDGGTKTVIATGFLDETDTHITPHSVEYVLTGRDSLSQLVDNDSVDSKNQIVNTTQISIANIMKIIIDNTRLPKDFLLQNAPDGAFLFQTNPGETKAASLQRYLEFTNCLVWSAPDGRMVVGKPNFKQKSKGQLILRSDRSDNNCLEARVRRNTNQAVRQIVTMLQGTGQVNTEPFTIKNKIKELLKTPNVGRSVFRFFSYGSGNEPVNTIVGTGNSGSPWTIGNQLSQREIAKENMKVLDVEVVVKGHINSNGQVFGVDEVYDCDFDDDDVHEPLYVYHCSYELTIDHGMLTRLKLCKINTIVATADAI